MCCICWIMWSFSNEMYESSILLSESTEITDKIGVRYRDNHKHSRMRKLFFCF